MAGNDQDKTTEATDPDTAVEEAEGVREGTASESTVPPTETAAASVRKRTASGRGRADGSLLRTQRLARFYPVLLLALKGLIFGIIAAVAGVLAATIWQNQTQRAMSVDPHDTAVMEERIATLEDQIVMLENQTADNDAAIVFLQNLAGNLEAARELFANLDPDDPGQILPAIGHLHTTLDRLAKQLDGVADRQAWLLKTGESEQAARRKIANQVELLTRELAHLRSQQHSLAAVEAETGPDDRAQGLDQAEDASGAPFTADLQQRITALDEQIAALGTALKTFTLDRAGLVPRLDALEQNMAGLTAREADDRQDFEIAIFNLGVAIETGAPYQALLNDLDGGGMNLPPALARHAATGTPTAAELLMEFDALASIATREDRVAGASGLASGIWRFLTSLVTVRPLTPEDGPTTRAILSRARFSLERGAIDDAIIIIDALPPPAAAAMADWVASATARARVLQALQDLTSRTEAWQNDPEATGGADPS